MEASEIVSCVGVPSRFRAGWFCPSFRVLVVIPRGAGSSPPG